MKSKIKFFIGLCSLSMSWQVAAANTTIVGNGGDSVKCESTSTNNFSGLYALDYLLTYTESNRNSDITPVFNWMESLARLNKILKKHPDLNYSFQNFVLDLQNNFDPLRPKIWHESSFGLVDIKDERIIRKVPGNCYKFTDPETIQIIQTIVRTERPDSTVYAYDPKIIKEFEDFAPLQYSFLLVHEWLWDIAQDVQVIRDLNRFLHSDAAERMKESDFRLAVTRIGVDFRPKQFKNVCNRDLLLRDEITQLTRKSCENVTEADLGSLKSLIVIGGSETSSQNLGYFELSDFSGFSSLSELKLTNLGLNHLFEQQLAACSYLNDLALDDNNFTQVPRRQLAQLENLNILSMKNNQIIKLNTDDINLAPRVFMFNFSGNKISTLDFSKPRVVTETYPRRNYINLSHNELTDVPDSICQIIFGVAIYDNPNGEKYLDLSGNPLTETAKERIRSLPCNRNGAIVLD